MKVGERYATVVLSAASAQKQQDHARDICASLDRVRESVQKIVETYARTFRVNFSLAPASGSSEASTASSTKESIAVYETLLLRFCALHRLQVLYLAFKTFKKLFFLLPPS